MCVCVCVCARARASARALAHVCVLASVHARARSCMCMCVNTLRVCCLSECVYAIPEDGMCVCLCLCPTLINSLHFSPVPHSFLPDAVTSTDVGETTLDRADNSWALVITRYSDDGKDLERLAMVVGLMGSALLLVLLL